MAGTCFYSYKYGVFPFLVFLNSRSKFKGMRRNDSIVMVTRNVGLDLEILPHLLATSAGYIGLMGSNRRWDTTRSRLADAGIADAELDRIHAPIGIEIRAETPEEIAVSILAEVIGGRRGA